jgi:uncharacterized protein YjeT (DUF2065 family)
LGEHLFAALALFLVLEGALPFLAPKLWRETFARLVELRDGQIRFVGLISIVVGGAIYLYATH